MINKNILRHKPAGLSSGNAFVSAAGDLRFKSWAGQTHNGVSTDSLPLQYFFKKSWVAKRRNDEEMGFYVNSLNGLAISVV